MPKLIDKYSHYEIDNIWPVASTLLLGYLGDKVSEEKKMEILHKLTLPTDVGAPNVDDVRRVFGDRYNDIMETADNDVVESTDNSTEMPGYMKWVQKGVGGHFKDPRMEAPLEVFEDGMREMLELLEENEKDLDLSDPNAQNHYQMLKGMLKNSYEGTLISKMTEDPSYGTAIAMTAKIAFELGTPKYNEEEEKFYFQMRGTSTKDVLKKTADLGILEAMAGNTRVMDKLQENISNGNTSRQELLYECEEQSKRLNRVFKITEEQVEKLRGENILQNDRSEYTDGDRGIMYSVYDMKAKQELLKAGYPTEDIAPMSAYYVQMSLYNRAIDRDQAKLDDEKKSNKEPDEKTQKGWDERQEKINNMKEAAQNMQKTWNEITDPEQGPLTEEKRLANLEKMKQDFQFIIEKKVPHDPLNQFKDRIDKRMNAELSTGDRAMLAGDYNAMYEALKEADPRSLFTGSKQFKELKNSMKELAEMDQRLSAEDKKTDLTYSTKRKEVMEKAQTYLRYKNRQMNGPEGYKHKRSALEAKRVQAVDGLYNRLLADVERNSPGISLTESQISIEASEKDKDLLTPMPKGEPKNFEEYMRVHTGKGAMSGTKAEMIDDMSKVLAAQIMPRQDPPKKFDPKVIDKAAEQIRDKFNLAGMKTIDLRAALNNPESVKGMAQKQHSRTYSVEPKEYADYLKSMRILYRDMEKPDGSSKEYQKIYDNVKKIAHLPSKPEQAGVSPQKLGKLIEQANSQIFENMDRYVDKNAKQIGPRDPKILQVLDVMSNVSKQTVKRADRMVDRINKAKGMTDISAPEYIELEVYGRGGWHGLRKAQDELTLDTNYRKDILKGLQMDEREKFAFEREKLATMKEQSLQKQQSKEAPIKGHAKLEPLKETPKKYKEVGDKAAKNYAKNNSIQKRKKVDNGMIL